MLLGSGSAKRLSAHSEQSHANRRAVLSSQFSSCRRSRASRTTILSCALTTSPRHSASQIVGPSQLMRSFRRHRWYPFSQGISSPPIFGIHFPGFPPLGRDHLPWPPFTVSPFSPRTLYNVSFMRAPSQIPQCSQGRDIV